MSGISGVSKSPGNQKPWLPPLTAVRNRSGRTVSIFRHNGAAHGVANDMGLGDAEMVHQPDHIVHHFDSVLARIGRLVALSMAAAVEGDNPAVMGEVVNHLGPHLGARGPAVNENDGRTLPEGHIANANAIRIKELVIRRNCSGASQSPGTALWRKRPIKRRPRLR